VHGRGELGAEGQAVDLCVGHGRLFCGESRIVTRVEESSRLGTGIECWLIVGDLVWKTELFETEKNNLGPVLNTLIYSISSFSQLMFKSSVLAMHVA
jgi:hypothetical protein